jgi:hypothetical protein
MKMEKLRRPTKIIASAIVGAGTTKLTSQIIANNTDTPEKLTDKVTIGVASAVVGTMAVERTKSWTDTKIDLFFDRWNKAGETAPPTETTDPQ